MKNYTCKSEFTSPKMPNGKHVIFDAGQEIPEDHINPNSLKGFLECGTLTEVGKVEAPKFLGKPKKNKKTKVTQDDNGDEFTDFPVEG